MAYNRKFYYKRVLEAQIFVLRIQKEHRGLPLSVIYRDYVRDKFHISKSTFDRWMGEPAALKLAEIEREEQREKNKE